jgi:thiamine kinase-like enzyme
MDDIDLHVFSKLASEKLGKEVEFSEIEKIGSGYHSDGFKLTAKDGSAYFLKYIKSHDLGFEFPERQAMTLMVSNGMGHRAAGTNPPPVGVIVLNEDERIMLPEFDEKTQVFHLQEFGGTGTSYSSLLEGKEHKTTVDDEDKEQLNKIADELVSIHSVKYISSDHERLNAIYNDGIRNMLIHPELSTMVLSEFPDDYAVLNLEEQKELIGLMYENIKAWMNRGDRLTALHGDFWGANIFFRDDGSIFVIDFSRIPWGDPAIDAGWFIAQFLWKYHETGNSYWKDMVEAWLTIYQEKSRDKELRKALPLVIGWTGIVQVYPRWFPNINVEVGRKYMDHVREILKNKEFIWKD